MPITRHLTFANIASGTALALAVFGGGYAVAGGALAHNSVGSSQIKKNGVHSSDIKDNAVTGKDVKESSLGVVPSATRAGSAAAVDTVVTKRATANPGQTVTLYTKDSLVIELTCTDNGAGDLASSVNIRTTVDHAAFDANLDGAEEDDFLISDGPEDIVSEDDTTVDLEDGGFSALSAGGVTLKGYGFAMVHPGGANSCLGDMTFFG